MRIVVTGGCGFIGSHLVSFLVREGAQVAVIDDLSTGNRENIPNHVRLIEGDIAAEGIFHESLAEADAVYHLAAIASVERSRTDWYRAHQVNIGGTVNLFHSIAQSGRKIPVVYASSAAVYGDCKELPITESSATCPLSSYGADKLACEQHGKIAAELHGIPNAGMRFFNVYGPNQDPASPYSGVISIFMDRAAKGLPITIFGDGNQSRDFVFVEDVVKSLMAAMAKLQKGEMRHNIFNIGTGNPVTIRELAEKVTRIAGSASRVNYGPARQGEILHSLCRNTHAAEVLGYTPAISLEQGLQATYGSLRSAA